MTVTIPEGEGIDRFKTSLSGRVLTPEDVEYDHVRALHNGLIDKRPALIARCQQTADVVDAVRLARETNLEISVRGGGHNVAGRAATEGGLMIDLQPMKGVHVDPQRRRVMAQAGNTWQEYNRATHAYGVATTGGVVSTTGIAGLTLGGGLGWLMGQHGLAVDNLLSAEIVTAGGEIRTASPDHDPDLFWAVRGGGGNFGIATSLEYAAYPLTSVTGGIIAFDLQDAASVFEAYGQLTLAAPDELTVFCALVHAPDGSGQKIVGIPMCHCGPLPVGERSADQFRKIGAPLVDMLGPMPYPVVNTLLDDGFPKGARNYWKSAFFRELSAETIDVMVECFKRTPSIMSNLVVEHIHGQVTRIPAAETAYPHREEGYNLVLISQWLDPADDEINIAWAKDTFTALAPYVADAAYVNYLSNDDGDRIRAAYGPNWDRLRTLKDRYDPDNVFHLNQNIPPN